MSNSPKRIVTLGGGTGQAILLSGLRRLENVELTAIVNTVDSGGSSGRLRSERGVLPPGDALKCLLALSPCENIYKALLSKRFSSKKLKGHNAGNLLITILAELADDFNEGTSALASILGAKGRVLTVTKEMTTLIAEYEDGTCLVGESVIDRSGKNKFFPIKNIFLKSSLGGQVSVNLESAVALAAADFIIIGPGDLYTSIIPNLLVKGVSAVIKKAKAPVIYILNLSTKAGETDNYTARNFVETIEKYLEKRIDYLIVDEQNSFRTKNTSWVNTECLNGRGRTIIKGDIYNQKTVKSQHDSKKLVRVLNEIIKA